MILANGSNITKSEKCKGVWTFRTHCICSIVHFSASFSFSSCTFYKKKFHSHVYVYSRVCIPYNCTVRVADLTYISLLAIFYIFVSVTNKNPDVLPLSMSLAGFQCG